MKPSSREGGTSRRPESSVTVFGTREELAAGAASLFAQLIGDALGERDRCTFAVSRPHPDVFHRLATADLRWGAVHLFQVDERAAPDGDDARNLTLIEREFVAAITEPGPSIHPMPAGLADLDEAAAAYERELVGVCSQPPVLDVVHLGLGADGHTASLVPGDPVLEVIDRWVAPTRPYEGFRRLTLTFPALEAARNVVFVVSGTEKADALRRVLDGDRAVPAARLRGTNVRFLVDEGALG